MMITAFLVILATLLTRLSASDIPVEADAENVFVQQSSNSEIGFDLEEEISRSREFAQEYDPPLIRAASNGELQLLVEFLRDGAAVDEKTVNGWSALSFAVVNDHFDIAEELIRVGADINSVENDGWSPLMFAAFQGNFRLAELLVNNNADLNLQNNKQLTAHELALLEGHEELALYLGEQSVFYSIINDNPAGAVYHLRLGGIDVNLANSNGWTALSLSASLGDTDSVRELIFDLQADVNQPENDGWTPLLFAANNGHAYIVYLLLKAGADERYSVIREADDGQQSTVITARKLAESNSFGLVIAVLDAFESGTESSLEFEEVVAQYELQQKTSNINSEGTPPSTEVNEDTSNTLAES